MKKTIELDGFPISSNKLDIPIIEELIGLEYYHTMDLDYIYKNGNDLYRWLISKAPIKNDKKYNIGWFSLQYIRPNGSAIKYQNNWHIDGVDDRLHLLLSDCTALTEFNTVPMSFEVDHSLSHLECDKFINENVDRLGIIPKKIESNAFYTFTSKSAHRAIPSEVPEFRFSFRIVESDILIPLKPEQNSINKTFIFEDYKKKENIERFDDGIFIYRS